MKDDIVTDVHLYTAFLWLVLRLRKQGSSSHTAVRPAQAFLLYGAVIVSGAPGDCKVT